MNAKDDARFVQAYRDAGIRAIEMRRLKKARQSMRIATFVNFPVLMLMIFLQFFTEMNSSVIAIFVFVTLVNFALLLHMDLRIKILSTQD